METFLEKIKTVVTEKKMSSKIEIKEISSFRNIRTINILNEGTSTMAVQQITTSQALSCRLRPWWKTSSLQVAKKVQVSE